MTRFLLPVLFFLISFAGSAQCAMCRAALETNDGGIKPESVNDGIVYLMVFPYLLVGLVGYAVYRLKTKKKEGQ